MKKSFICQKCGHTAIQWTGQCDSCGSWNSLTEQHLQKSKKNHQLSNIDLFSLNSITCKIQSPNRISSNISELDRVLGGGIIPGSVILLGGSPGIGKSTLLLQLINRINKKCIYISGEESVSQIHLRAQRINIQNQNIKLASNANVPVIINSIIAEKPTLLVIDSIQTMEVPSLNTIPGSITQIRTATSMFIQIAKEYHIAIFLVGHVTKDGALAGPRILEHMVDTVLHFEGDSTYQFRLLRGIKNRFGPTQEIGVFDMRTEGLQEVQNPSALFLENRHTSIPGSCVFSHVEGTRSLLVEVQALAATSGFSIPRRTSVGWSTERLLMILAVLEMHAGFSFVKQDIYLNIAGGIRIIEPAADLSVALALISSISNQAIPLTCAAFGEIALNGEIRSVSHTTLRIMEAKKLGFTKIMMPKTQQKIKTTLSIITIHHVKNIHKILKEL